MKIYEQAGINNFFLCLGHQQHRFKEYFSRYFYENSTFEYDLSTGNSKHLCPPRENWKVILNDSGLNTETGLRLKSSIDYIHGEEVFFTYGDSVVDVDVRDVLSFHKKHGKLVTMTAIRRRSTLGELEIDGDKIVSMDEKKVLPESWFNGGFFVVNKRAIEMVSKSTGSWERDILPKLSSLGQLMAYKHEGFWHPLDTPKDQNSLENYLANCPNNIISISR